MDVYTFSLLLGGTGLATMAVSGLARHSGSHAAGTHGSAGHGSVGHASDGHASAPAIGHAGATGLAHVAHAHGAGSASHVLPHAGAQPAVHSAAPRGPTPDGAAGRGGSASHATHGLSGAVWAQLGVLISPRVIFGILLGLGTAGVLLAPVLAGILRFAAALLAGLLFDRLLLSPLWNFSLRFASAPALTLEMAVTGEAKAVTNFDANGQGIVQIELDGQVVQVLATLLARDRSLGHRVRAGEAVRVEEVDPVRNRCSVTVL
jgi:hypothetical protein